MIPKNYKPIAILGNPDTCKTNLSVYLARICGLEKRYVLGYPGKIEGFTNLNDIKDLAKISDCVLFIDEIDEIVPLYDKKSNEALKRLLKFAAHNRIKLIFNTQLSQFVTRMMEALVPQWAITELDIFSLKQGSKPKRILLNYLKLPEIVNNEIGMKLEKGRFIWYNEYGSPGESGSYVFPDQQIGKDWSNSDKKSESIKSKKSDIGKIKAVLEGSE